MRKHEANTLVDEAKIFYGSNMALACFSKKFASDEIAVATFFNITEAKLKVAEGYEKLGRKELAEEQRRDAEQILSAALQDYPNSKLADQGYFLLGEMAKKLGNYRAAEERFSTVLARWPDSDYAPKAMYQRGLALEKGGRAKKACEEYVRLTYMFPDSTLVGDATARLGNYFYKQKLYGISGEIFHKFQMRNESHELAPKALLLAGISYTQNENYEEAAKVLTKLVKKYKKDPDLRAQGMYRLGSAYMKEANYQGAYESWKQLTWDHPETKWAQVARGKLQQKVLRKLE
jgi:TolA-binding protein